jgi:hypothetical protein
MEMRRGRLGTCCGVVGVSRRGRGKAMDEY